MGPNHQFWKGSHFEIFRHIDNEVQGGSQVGVDSVIYWCQNDQDWLLCSSSYRKTGGLSVQHTLMQIDTDQRGSIVDRRVDHGSTWVGVSRRIDHGSKWVGVSRRVDHGSTWVGVSRRVDHGSTWVSVSRRIDHGSTWVGVSNRKGSFCYTAPLLA